MFRREAITNIQRTLHNSQQNYNKTLENDGTKSEDYQKKVLQLNIDITVGTYFLKHYNDPNIGSRLWSANWSNSMIQQLCDSIILPTDEHNLQYTPLYMINQLRKSLIQYSTYLANYLPQIWSAKANCIRKAFIENRKINNSTTTITSKDDIFTPPHPPPTSISNTTLSHKPPKTNQHPIHTSEHRPTPKATFPIYDITNITAALHATLNPYYIIHDVPADGNCMFHALAHQLQLLHHNHISALSLRQDTTHWLLVHPDHITPTTNQLISDTRETHRDKSWEEYCHIMLQPGTYGEAPHLWAVNAIYNITIHSYSIQGQQILHSAQENPQHIYLAHYEPIPHFASLILKPTANHPPQQPIPQTQILEVPQPRLPPRQKSVKFPT